MAESKSKVAKPIRELKPGWTSRVFGIETARLVACDARWDGDDWKRDDKFRFLYRSKRGKFLALHDVHTWGILTEPQAQEMYRELPEHLESEEKTFEKIVIEPVARSRDDEEDERIYKIVRNDNWDFSIWLDYKELPRGWFYIGVTGRKQECLEFINQNCVFGAPNPGIL